jgi:hypothetical protein
MKFKTKLLIVTALVFCAGLSRNVMACPGITLPAATTGNTSSFGEALVYSLPIFGINTSSSPDRMSDCVVVALDSNGALVGFNAGGSDIYVARGSQNFRSGDSTSSSELSQTSEANGGAAITWDTMLGAIRAFLANRPILANFGLPGNQARAATEPQNGAAVTSDAAPAGGEAGPAGGNEGPVGGDSAPAGGDASLPAVTAVASPELNTLLAANFDVAVVPEPGTLALFAAGLLVLGLWGVKRK